MSDATEKLNSVRVRISKALSESKFDQAVKLIGASKKQSVENLSSFVDAGLKDFGENYVQEALPKKESLSDSVCWHFIGAVQSKKAKDLVGQFEWIHGVGTDSSLKTLNKEAQKKSLKQKVLLQINPFDEETKSGFSEAEFKSALPTLATYEHLEVKGLMSMPPPTDDELQARSQFAKVRELLLLGQKTLGETFSELSIGTSSDFEAAIKEGATMIRLGTVLLGERV